MVIMKLKERIKSLSGNLKEEKIKRKIEEIETINIKLDHRVTKLVTKNEHLKQTYKQLYDSIKSSRIRSKEQCDDLIKQVNIKSAKNSDLNACLQENVLVITALKDTLRKLKGKAVVDKAVILHPIDPELLKIDVAPLAPKLRNNRTVHYDYLKHTQEETATLRELVKNVVQIVLLYLDFGCSKHMTEDGSRLTNFVNKFLGTVKLGNDHVAKIMGYGDYKIGNVTILRVYFVEGLGHNLFSVRQFCDSSLEVAFHQHTCFIRNLEGVDLLTGSRGNNLYTMSLGYMMASSPNGLLFKASKTKSKDEAPDFIIKFLKMIQVRLKVPVRRIRTNNGIEFVNQTMREYYEQVDISHETSVSRSPQQNVVVERRNRKLIEAAHTIRTRRIVETIHVDFDELTAMDSEQSSLGTALHEMTPATISSGLVPKPTSSTPFVPPLRNDWDLLFQPLFDELLTPPTSVDPPAPKVITLIDEVISLELVELTGLPSSTTIDQDAPSPSKSQTTSKTQPPVIPRDVKEDNHDIKVPHMGKDPLFGKDCA
nr:integrase, catalytic region, zinc finger, CCHC-type, peptidase aspartic, catalytic [Tanacetum cinerariifolium]